MRVADFIYDDYDYNIGLMIAGALVMLIGYVGMIFASIAVYLNFTTDTMTDNTIKRLYPPVQKPPSPPTSQP